MFPKRLVNIFYTEKDNNEAQHKYPTQKYITVPFIAFIIADSVRNVQGRSYITTRRWG